jgi:hypothetical protein
MQKNYPNKAISNKDIAEPTSNWVEFNFPEHEITVKARTPQEAQDKLEEKLKQKSNKLIE